MFDSTKPSFAQTLKGLLPYFAVSFVLPVLILLLMLLMLDFWSTAEASAANSCHCFKDRTFDPENPGKVDVYLLATTQNSFLSAVYDITKAEVIRAKMSSRVSGEDLWVAIYISSKTQVDIKLFLSARKKTSSWKKALESAHIPVKDMLPELAPYLAKDASSIELSAAIVDMNLIEKLGARPEEIQSLRNTGADNKQTIISAFLALKTSRPATEIFATVSSNATSWGNHINLLGIEPKNMDVEIYKLLKAKK